MNNATQKSDPKLIDLASACTDRISRVHHQGRYYWVKRKEALSLRFRLQKGFTASSLEKEVSILRELAAANVPVPEIAAQGPDFVVLPDYGKSLKDLLLSGSADETGILKRAFTDGATALADLHMKGFSHGRPYLRDICWNDGQITFIDFEYYTPARNNLKGHARDVFIFFFNGLTLAGQPVPELEIAREHYLAKETSAIWQEAREIARRYRWVNWATKPIQMRRTGKAKEFKAIPLAMEWFGV